MRYAIVTPTYVGHFQFIPNYLKSYDQYVLDKEQIEIIFTINRTEKEQFQTIIAPYLDSCHISVLYLEDLLEKENITLSPDELLHKYGTYTYQTLKKFLTIHKIGYDWCLILDSESMWIRPTEMCKLFQDYMKDPYVVGSAIGQRKKQSRLFRQVIQNAEYLLNCSYGNWYIETFSWFYNREILENLFKEHGTPYELAKKIAKFEHRYGIEPPVGIMEGPLYYTYLYKNRDRYHYRFINILDECKKYLGTELLRDYLRDFFDTYDGHAGIVEYATMLLNDKNVQKMAQMFKQNNFNIIRCEYSDRFHIKNQKKFMEIVEPHILAVSQNHWFGVNDDPQKIRKEEFKRTIRGMIKRFYYGLKGRVKEIRRRFSFTFKMTWLINEKIDFLINENRYHYDSLRDQIIEQRCDIKRLLCELLAISNGEAPTITVEELKKMLREIEMYSNRGNDE